MHTWRKFKDLVKPIFGINCGTLGFLTEGTIDNWQDKLFKIMQEHYKLENRMTICGSVYKDNCCIYSNVALNDVVLSKNTGSAIRFTVFVNGKYLTSSLADGLICSTPTGSTGYALSAGGSFIDPSSEMIELVSIAPHTLLNRSIILSKDSFVELVIDERSSVLVSFDGIEYSKELTSNDHIVIEKSNDIMIVAVVDDESFINTISQTFA